MFDGPNSLTRQFHVFKREVDLVENKAFELLPGIVLFLENLVKSMLSKLYKYLRSTLNYPIRTSHACTYMNDLKITK